MEIEENQQKKYFQIFFGDAQMKYLSNDGWQDGVYIFSLIVFPGTPCADIYSYKKIL